MELRFAKWGVSTLLVHSADGRANTRQNGKQGENKDLAAANESAMAESAKTEST